MYPTPGDAIPDICADLVLVKDNKLVCKVSAFGSMDAEATLNFPEDFFDEHIAPKVVNAISSLTMQDGKVIHATKFCCFRYCQFSGVFLGCNLSKPEPGLTDWLKDTRVVDSVYLKYGMVPDSFSEVEGYRSGLSQSSDAVAENPNAGENNGD
jgi:hypothetical protein